MAFFDFGKKKKVREAQIEAVKKDTYRKIDKASKSIKRVSKLLDDDVTLQIYYATRKKGVK